MRMIYFAGCQGLIKIGTSLNVQKRLAALQSGCPYPIKLLAAYPGGPKEERRLHRQFLHLRTRGEWHQPGADLRALIREVQAETTGWSVGETNC